MTQGASPAPAAPPHRTLNILHVITKGEAGGAQTHVRTLCSAQQATGRITPQVAIGGSDTQPPLAQALQARSIPLLRIPDLGNRLTPAAVWRAVRTLRSHLQAHPADLLHAHSAAAGVIARLAGRLAHVPVVYTVHGFAFKAGAPWSRRIPAWAVECALAPLTRAMVCVSGHEAQLARTLPIARDRVFVVHNGVEDCTERAQPEDGAPRIAMVARLAAPKRPDLLLQALGHVRDALRHELPATLIGDGPMRGALEAQAQQLGLAQISFTGDVDDVPRRLACHAIGVLVSDHEGLPLAVIEAMRAGQAIVASDLPGTRELLPDDTCGLRVPNNPAALADALLRLAADPALRGRLGQAARARYAQHHAPDTMAAGVLRAYERALA